MERYDSRLELAPRDVVSRSIWAEMQRTGRQWVYLDLTHLDGDFVRGRFPKIHLTCLRYGLDMTRVPIPVSPAAHYLMGGIRTDVHGRTTLPGLYAAGEATCTGVHGANRLASNSLLEGLVFGARAGEAAREEATHLPRPEQPASAPIDMAPGDWLVDPRIRHRVQEVMWSKVGLIRTGDQLAEAVAEIGHLVDEAPNNRTRHFVTLAHLIATAAQWREESRGGHYRADHPERDDRRWQVHSSQRIGHPIRSLPQIGF